MLDIFLTTLLHRPYVVAFLLAYVFIAARTHGWRWMFSYLILGYTVAFLSEFSSIHFGFPYGWYFYDTENLKGEWLNHGVPVWDSVSYVFMNFAGLCLASRGGVTPPGNGFHQKIQTIILSAVFVTLLDVIVDPVAHRGAEWFLGHIYYYPTPGPYFDVTLANFAGWFLVSLVINSLGVLVLPPKFAGGETPPLHDSSSRFLILGLYFGIVGFGVAIAIGLKAWNLLICDIFWVALILLMSKKIS
jgi:putative membrane protein